MDTTVLLEKLIDIERFIGVEPDSVIRRKVIDIEDYIVTEHEEAIESFRRAMRIAADEETAMLRKAQGSGAEAQGEARNLDTALRLVWSNPATAIASRSSTMGPIRLTWPPPCA
jgi:hypothetical protein